jgi:glutamyl-tRNA synthetase
MLTRLAPSPTGALHLGNARTFLVNWLLARQNSWKILLRIEDLDGPRIKPHSAQQAMDDLRWLGIDWDIGPVFQSARLQGYSAALQQLLAGGHAYPCVCTRREVELAASAPHAEDGASVYPGTCRGRFSSVAQASACAGRPPAIRFAVPDKAAENTLEWTDGFAGPQRCRVADQLGDFVIAKADGTPAYQLAVVVDDLEGGVTHVVRGDDLLDSTPRQMLLYRALGKSSRIPVHYHLPLVVGTDGRRLAKRHGDTRISHLRQSKVGAPALLELLADWCGMPNATAASAGELLSSFSLSKMPTGPIVFDSAKQLPLLFAGR